jgi:hypothetical protein
MENLVFPAIQRFGHAMHAGQDTCKKIGQQFQDSEEEAGSLFKTDDGAGANSGGGAGGAAGGAIPAIIRRKAGIGGREKVLNPLIPGINDDRDTHEAAGVVGSFSGGAGAGIGIGASTGAGAGNSGSMDQIGQMGGGKSEDSSELGAEIQAQLQAEMSEKSIMEELISNVMKKAQDTANGIIGNLK